MPCWRPRRTKPIWANEPNRRGRADRGGAAARSFFSARIFFDERIGNIGKARVPLSTLARAPCGIGVEIGSGGARRGRRRVNVD